MEQVRKIVIYKLKTVEKLIKAGFKPDDVEINRKYGEGLCFRFTRNSDIDVILKEDGVLNK